MFRDALPHEYKVANHGGNRIVFFTQNYTENVLRGQWCPDANSSVPHEFGEAIKPEGGSWSWDLREYYIQKDTATSVSAPVAVPVHHHVPASGSIARSAPSAPHARYPFRDAEEGEYFVMNSAKGQITVYFTQEYTEKVLQGQWIANDRVPSQFGEAWKSDDSGSCWSLKLSDYYYDRCKHQWNRDSNPPFAPREAVHGEFGVFELTPGTPIALFTKEYTERVLEAKWCPVNNCNIPSQFGEALKPEGGSWSWDLRTKYHVKLPEHRVEDCIVC
jgi:hypothetical protein